MLQITLDQMRTSLGRLLAAGIAIGLGTAFIAASLLTTATMQLATQDSFTAGYADADLVAAGEDLTMASTSGTDDLSRIRDTPGVRAAEALAYLSVEITAHGITEYVGVRPTPTDPELAVGTLAEGTEAVTADQIVLPSDPATRIGLGVGDVVEAAWTDLDGEYERRDLTIVGLLAGSNSVFTSDSDARVAPAVFSDVVADQLDDSTFSGDILILLDPGADPEAVRSALLSQPDLAGLTISTIDEIGEQLAEQVAGSSVVFLTIMLAFAAVALTVAGMVISNTFQVLVAQRARTLALLRCVGASRRQLRGSVLLEAALLGAVASLAGLALGSALVIGGVQVLTRLYPQAALASTVPYSIAVPLVTLVTGVIVTLVSAMVPARMATRVAPIAALRPVEGAAPARASRRQLGFSVVLTVAGLVMLGGGSAMALTLAGTALAALGVLGGLAVGILGGLFTVSGLMVGSVFIVPRVLPWLGRIAGRGVPARIATANAVRNPRRTATTTNALVIAVALVVMMSTGALSARQTLLGALDEQYPVDLMASTSEDSLSVTDEQVAAIASSDGVSRTLTARTLTFLDVRFLNESSIYQAVAFTDDAPGPVVRDPSLVSGLADGVLVVSDRNSFSGASDGASVTARSANGSDVQLRLVHAPLVDPYTVFVTQSTMDRIAPNVPVNTIWARFADNADAPDVAARAQQRLNEVGVDDPQAAPLWLSGSGVQRGAFEQVIDTLLALVLGLLAVAVVIALIGVANTLSLSVIERRRENATLRALGLTRHQLRGMLAVEGVLIATVGALIGTVAGLFFGWAGSAIVLGGFGNTLRLGVPWLQLLAVLVIAVAAGLLASVVPARSALKQSPVAALATD